MEQHAADIKKEGTETVGKKMMAAMMANPSMSQKNKRNSPNNIPKSFNKN